jgi:cytochrome c oxidase assembly protein subunit 15
MFVHDSGMSAIAEFQTPYAAHGRAGRNRTLVRGWLYVALLVMFALFLVGGATRLTDSGLSITEWQPIHGVVPPLSDADWEEEFSKYQQTPEYKQLNAGMSLGEFKTIFWWEWVHRILARGVGAVFALPLLFFWATGRLEQGVKPKLVGLLLLGGLQGAVGWWMVASGLVDRTDVSQYRLATHLLLACLIFTATFVVARGLAPHSAPPADRGTQRFAGLLLVLVLVQIYLGGLVAGIDGGMSYNTWPLMDGSIVPGDLLVIDPTWRNLFENPKTVQFVHRCGAYVIFLTALWHMIATRRHLPGTTHARRALVLFHLVLAQAVIGITTLVLQVPLRWALTHQAVALIVLGFAAAHWRATKGSYPFATEIAVRG